MGTLLVALILSPHAPVKDRYLIVELNEVQAPDGRVRLRQLVFWDTLPCGHTHACDWEAVKTVYVGRDTFGTFVRFRDSIGYARKVYCTVYRTSQTLYDVEIEDRKECTDYERRRLCVRTRN